MSDDSRTAEVARYEERKRLGLCVRCGERDAEVGLASCEPCRVIVNQRRKPQVTRGPKASGAPFNVCCQAVGFHRADCAQRR